jgi:hypothetical protein
MNVSYDTLGLYHEYTHTHTLVTEMRICRFTDSSDYIVRLI